MQAVFLSFKTVFQSFKQTVKAGYAGTEGLYFATQGGKFAMQSGQVTVAGHEAQAFFQGADAAGCGGFAPRITLHMQQVIVLPYKGAAQVQSAQANRALDL